MNKDKFIELLKDGASMDELDSKFYHPSFRKGWRKVTSGNISWWAAKTALRSELVCSDKLVYTIKTNSPFKNNAPYNPEFLGAQPARAGQDY